MNHRIGIGILAALASAVAYGVNIVFARAATLEGVPPADLVVLRVSFMLAAVTLVGLAFRSRFVVPLPARGLALALGVTTAGIGLAYFYAVSRLPISIATLVFYIFPLLILIVSPFVDRERFTLDRLAIFAMAFAGLAVALGPSFDRIDMLGVVLALVASLFTTAQFFLSARAGQAMDQVTLIFWSHLIVVPIALVFALSSGVGHWDALVRVGGPVAISVSCYLVAFALQMFAAREAPPALIGLVFCLEPVVSIVVAGFVLGETLTASHMIGSLMVLASLIACSVLALRQRPTLPNKA